MLEVIEGQVDVSSDVLARERESFFPTYDRLKIGEVERAEGCYIYTKDGRRYLDAIAGLGVNALGHSHPDVVAAITEQASKYLHLSNLYVQGPQLALAEKLREMSGWDRVFFTNSGTEAIEAAIKLVRKYFGDPAKTEVIGLANSFHGRTYGALSIMDKEKYRKDYAPFLTHAKSIPYSVEGLKEAVSNQTAAVFLEVIQGEGGIVEVSPEFVTALHALRDQYKFLIVADEIQSGIGRTGTFFAYEHYGLKPDVVVCAKAIGGGLPLGAVLSSSKIANAFSAGVHGTTFGGNALACAAGLVVLEKLEGDLRREVEAISARLRAELEKLGTEFPNVVGHVRGRGLMLGIELKERAAEIHAAILNENVVTNLTAGNILRLLPPLVFGAQEIEELVNAIRSALKSPRTS